MILKQLEKFKLIYRKEFNKEISDQEALRGITELLRLVDIIYGSLIKNKMSNKNIKFKKYE